MRLLGPGCGGRIPEEDLAWQCQCGSYLNCPDDGFRFAPDPSLPGIWRYASSLPVADPKHPVTLGEGMTPLVPCRWENAAIFCKLDSLSPSGSYKDRGIAVLVSRLKELGVTRIVEDSSGNAGASMAAYCAAAGIAGDFYVPQSASEGKCVQIAAYGANLVPVPGPREATTEAAEEAAKKAYYASHNWSPYFPAGLKTLGFEIFEQMGDVPDNVICPAGQGSLVRGVFDGFSEIRRSGKISRIPRVFGVQAEACRPLYEAWIRGEDQPRDVAKADSMAEGILSAFPVRGDGTIRAVRESGGAFTTVSEKAIWEAFKAVAGKGLYFVPTSAGAFAGLIRCLAEGVIAPGEKTVVVVSGIGLKATDKILELRRNPPA